METVYIESADEDYVAARVLWEHRLTRPFLWHAAQAIEKYLKASCLVNGESAKFGHKLSKGFEKVVSFAPELVPKYLERPTGYTNEEPGEFKEATSDFVERYEALGSPESRYSENEIAVDSYDIVKFDLFCKIARRLTINVDGLHDGKPARHWLALKPNQITRPFFAEPTEQFTKTLLNKGNYGFFENPETQPETYFHWSAQALMRAYQIDIDVRSAAQLLAKRTIWSEEYFLEKVLIPQKF